MLGADTIRVGTGVSIDLRPAVVQDWEAMSYDGPGAATSGSSQFGTGLTGTVIDIIGDPLDTVALAALGDRGPIS